MFKSFKYIFFVFMMATSWIYGPVTTVRAASLPAEINKQFTPISIDAGAVSVLRVTVFNPNTFPLTDVSWSDNLIGVQPGLSIANPAGATTNCAGGSVVAVSGTTSLSLSGATVPAQVGSAPGECYVEVNVTSTTSGNLINTIPANNLVATGNDNGTIVSVINTSPASATLTVIAVTPPSLTKGFAPNTIFVGELSQLTITINNNDADTNLTNTSYTDTLPTGLVLANPVSAVVTNCGAYTLNATDGGSTIQLTNATVTPSQNCVVRINVTGTMGQYTNTIPAGPNGPGSIVTSQGVTNLTPASADLNIQPIGLAKVFSPSTIVAGDTSTLTITLQNPTGSAYTNVSLTDNLPAGLEVSGSPTTTCGGTVTNTVSSVTLNGGSVPASATPPTPLGTCTITVVVSSPLTTVPDTLTNTIPANSITTAQPGVTNYLPAIDDITITAPLTGAKSYSPTIIALSGVSTVTITLTNNSPVNLTNVNFTDTLPANLTVSGTPSSPQCNGTITNNATSVTLAGGSIPAGTSCTIVFDVTSSVAGSGTTYENTIPANNITTDEGVGNSSTIRTGTDLTVVNSASLPVGVSKAFQTTPITPGVPTRLRITITAPTDTNLTGLNIVDTLPTGLVVVGTASTPPAPANPVDTCTGATVVAPIGGDTISLSGASLTAGDSCTITLYVTSSMPGTYDNIIPANTITTTQSRTNIVDSNTATVIVTSMSMSKAFYPNTVQADGLSTLTITLQNTTDSPLINVSITDTLPGSTTNGVVVAPVPNASTTCSGGVITADPGTQTITMISGIIPAQVAGVPGICTINIDVQGRDSSPTSPSTRTNTISTTDATGTVQSTGSVINPIAQAQDTLFIQPLIIGAVKGFNPVLVYGSATSTMTVQLNNPNNATLTGIAFTDNMALLTSGIVLANPVNFNVGTCGGTLTGSPGDSSFSFSGGTLPPNSSCSITLSVVMQVNGNRTNRIPAGAVTTFNGVSNPDPTEASLTNLPGVSIVKVFNPDTILIGQPTTLTITIENTNSIPVVDMSLTDNLPGTLPTGLEIASPNNASTTCGDTTGTPISLIATAGSQAISLVGAELPANAACNIIVNVTSSEPGVYINTIPANAITSQDGITNNNPTSSTLTVTASTSGFAKSMISTNEAHTTGNDVAIGEIVTYEIVIDVPVGISFNNTTITDQMDKGLAFVDCVSVFVLGVDQTGTVCPPAVSSITDVSDSPTNPANLGRQIVFSIGDVTATEPNQTITIQYRAILLDVIEIQSNVQLNNSVTWAWSGGSQTTSAPNVRIVEPDLDIDKSANPTTNVAIGTPIQFTLFIDHTTPASQTDAFDVVVTDILPATLEYVPCSAVYSGLIPTTNTASCPTPATNLTFAWDVFPLGETSTITFYARLLGSPAVNTASVAWTSIPIDPQIQNGLPVILSTHNDESTERWYDPLDDVNIYGVSASVNINSPAVVDNDEDLPSLAPATGFAPNRTTIVPEQPKEKVYTATNMWLEIPSLGVSMPIEGVPLVDGDWDVSWLVQQAGWLQGTAFPSWQGNSVLTSHVALADGTDGPFAHLGKLAWGEQIIIHAYDTRYIYEVRQNRTVSPYNSTIFQHEDDAWLTLVTCKNYNETTESYTSRVAVRAVLISTEEEQTYFSTEKTR